MSRHALLSRIALTAACIALASRASAEERATFRLKSVESRTSAFSQTGWGYQSQAGSPARLESPTGRGSERLIVFQPQLAAVFSQGARITHRLWLPVDVVTSASPDAIDVTTGASRHERANTADLTTTYEASSVDTFSARGGVHVEEHLRSWNVGEGYARSFANRAALLGTSLHIVLDGFERRKTDGGLHGRGQRATANGNVAFTQVLGPTTVAYVDYGLTRQSGELGTTWNVVPFDGGGRVSEVVPRERLRHAFVARLAQWLPWRGALKGYGRFYVDDWGIMAATAEIQLAQRIRPNVYVRGEVRIHEQTRADFYTERARDLSLPRTADSDLAAFSALTLGASAVIDIPWHPFGLFRIDAGVARYARSNDLSVQIATVGTEIVFD